MRTFLRPGPEGTLLHGSSLCRGLGVKLPGRQRAHIPRRKLTDYLLAEDHPVGGAKAEYFRSRGFLPEVPGLLEEVIRQVAVTGRVFYHEHTRWGRKFHVWARVLAPDGNPLSLSTVWIRRDDGPPSLVTAYPQPEPDP